MVFLKNSFHLALLQASLEFDFMRYPRFVLFDNIEDEGMEPERSRTFQELVVEVSEAADVEHQIILTTSMPNPRLLTQERTIGPAYSHENRSLSLPPTP